MVIGDSLGQFGNNANANIWADGFSAFGIAGMILETLVAMALFYLLDCITQDIDLKFILLIIAVHAMNLADIPIFTAILGQGLAFAVLLAVMAPRDKLNCLPIYHLHK